MYDRNEGHVNGILNNWDMAALLDLKGHVEVSTARHRTGTVPFMAVELLSTNPPAHLYRHDLQSFFYILIWAAIHYNIAEKSCSNSIHKVMSKWDDAMTVSAGQKALFYSEPPTSAEVLASIRPEFKELERQWIQPLLALFRRGRFMQMVMAPDPTQPYDHATYGGILTFHTFMAALGRVPRTLAVPPDEA
jgi:hypothetical protein